MRGRKRIRKTKRKCEVMHERKYEEEKEEDCEYEDINRRGLVNRRMMRRICEGK